MSIDRNRNVYVGHRYVPLIIGEWDKQETYEGLSIVTYQGTSYTSKKRVPVGIDILNEEFWAVTGNYNAQVEQYRQEVKSFDGRIKENKELSQSAINDLMSRGVNVLTNGVTGDGVTDDTEVIKDLIRNNSVVIVPIPPVKYRITDEIVIPSNRKIIFVGGNHWNVNQARNVTFFYDGEQAMNKAMFRASQSPVGQEPSTDTSNILFIGGVLLDGNGKIGYGFYGSYITNDSIVEGVTVVNTLVKGIDITKSWYARYSDLIARNNYGRGISFGENFWGGINGCLIENIRAWGNGINKGFTEIDFVKGSGIFISLGYGTLINTIVSERNYGAGLIYEHGVGQSNKLLGVYLEGNGQQAREEGLTNYNWGLIVKAVRGGGKGSTIETMYLSSGTPSQQSVWLTGEKPTSDFTLREVSGSDNGGVFIAEWDNYYLDNTPFGTKITGHLPKRINDIVNSNYTTLYVSKTGNDNNNGRTEGSSFSTIEKAIEVVKRINTINTIIINGLTVVNAVVDLKGVDREITIQGDNATKIGTTSNSSGLTIINASQPVTLVNVGKINRLNYTNADVIIEGGKLGNEDTSNNAIIEGKNGTGVIRNSTIDGVLSASVIKRAIRLNNAKITLVNTPINNLPNDNVLTLSNGSTLLDDTFKGSYHYTVFSDGTGYVIAGKRMRFAGGYIYNGDETV